MREKTNIAAFFDFDGTLFEAHFWQVLAGEVRQGLEEITGVEKVICPPVYFSGGDTGAN